MTRQRAVLWWSRKYNRSNFLETCFLFLIVKMNSMMRVVHGMTEAFIILYCYNLPCKLALLSYTCIGDYYVNTNTNNTTTSTWIHNLS